MTGFRTLDDIGDVTGKRVLVRVDLNLPMSDRAVADDTRIRAAMPTIRDLSATGALVPRPAHLRSPRGAKHPPQFPSLVHAGVAHVLVHSVLLITICPRAGARDRVAPATGGHVA